MSTKLNFNARNVEPQKPLEPIPDGWYAVTMDKSEVKPTSGGSGKQLRFALTVVDGDYKGRKIFDGLNIANKNATAQEIGQQQLSAICHAINVLDVTDTAQLHGKAFMVRVITEPAEDGYDARNKCKAFKAVEGNSVALASAKAAGATPPWAGKNAAPPAKEAAPSAEVKKGPGKPGAPKKPTPPPAKKTDDRAFYVYVNEESVSATGDEVAKMLQEGMPADTPVCLDGEDDWKTAADYGIGEEAAPATEPEPTPEPEKKNTPPWARKAK